MAKNISVLETVRALMARAEHPTTPPPEAELALRQANRLMVRHAIDTAKLRAGMTEAERRAPVTDEWGWMATGRTGHHEYQPYLRSMLEAIADANRCKAVIGNYPDYEVTVIGFREDVDWVQMLYTSCQLTFLSKLSPTWTKDLGTDANVYAFKVAGHSWNSIWGAMAMGEFDIEFGRLRTRHSPFADRGTVYTGRVQRDVESGWYDTVDHREAGLPCGPESPSNKYLLRAYRRHAKLIGDENPLETQRLDAYRRSFAKGFADRIAHRLWLMTQDSNEEVASSGQAVALRDAFADVEAEYYRRFPQYHPEERKRRQVVEAEKGREYIRKEREAREAMLANMTPSRRARFLEAEERKRVRDQASNERYWANHEERNRTDHSGANLGRKAADGVQLARATPVRDETNHRAKIGS